MCEINFTDSDQGKLSHDLDMGYIKELRCRWGMSL